MKKLLLGISLFALGANSYADGGAKVVKQKTPQAESLKVEIPAVLDSKALSLQVTGETSVNHYVFTSKEKKQNGGKDRETHLAVEDSLLNFQITGFAKDHEFGYLIGVTGNAEKGENPIKENRVKVKGCWGTILAGDTKSASDFMAVDTLYFAGGTGGVLGNYKNVINETTGSLLKTDLLDKLSPKDETKVVYVSPVIHGLQVAYTYIPDGSHRGEQKLASDSPHSHGIRTISYHQRLSGQNFHEAVVKYKTTFQDNFTVNLSGAAIWGEMRNLKGEFPHAMKVVRHEVEEFEDYKSNERYDLNAYSFGIVGSLHGFSIGTEYVNNGKSGQLKFLNSATMGNVWTFGAGWANDLNKISLVYFNSKRKLGQLEDLDFGSVQAHNVAFTYDRQILPGWTVYVEGIAFKMKNSQQDFLHEWNRNLNGYGDETVPSNKGKVLLTGTRFKF